MLLFILSCRMELTAYYRNRTFSNSQATFHSFSERCVTCHSRSPFNDMHEPIRYVLDHLDKWHLIWYGWKVPRERIMWIEIYAHCCFCNDSTLFLIFSLIADEIYEFFLGWWILFFFIRQWSRLYFPIKTVNKQSNTWSLVNSEFLFSCSTRRLTSERNELSANSSDIELNTRWEILCLRAPCIIRYFDRPKRSAVAANSLHFFK